MKQSYGLIGEKLGHSISPLIHQLIFEYCNLDGDYQLYELDRHQIGEFLKNTKLKGFNITIPYKIEITQYLDFIAEEAKAIGAVNTVNIVDNVFYGYNTDYYGIDITFKRHNINLKDASAIILGSGGASAAVFQYLKDSGCTDITIVVRDKSKVVNSMYKNLNLLTYNQLSAVEKKDLLINCTPVGMSPNIDQSPVSCDFVKGFSFIFDLIYNPMKTKLLSFAEQCGIKHCNGLLMLIGQAVHAQAIWNNILVSDDLLEKLYNELSKRGI
ncbi:shikimate dehydrogenase family protein [Clostridium thermarum]|uniref:shikimate dehydrogenase family protein n=1 Tax=Clostridium thermarum TaxID=1716543 RepID=UPI0013D6BC33|nr:shikimate dehydrogenase [Clostridium thermarum]